MITYLRLENFLRHQATEIHFEPQHQLVVVSGANGVGKSSLFAAISWALTGEAPKGLKIDQLVSWGAELEGCEVEVRFDVGGEAYQVLRRRSGIKTTASLYTGEGVLLADSPKAVAAEITRIFGVDSAGFRLAYLAEQRELDGLSEMTPAERARAISRMLRLDVLAAAKQKAREAFNEARIRTQTVANDVDLDALRAAVDEARTARDAATAGLTEARQALSVIDAELAATADVDLAYHTAQKAVAAAEATLAAVRAEHDRMTAAVARFQVPSPLPAPDRSADVIEKEATDLERAIVAAEHAANTARQRHTFEQELAEVTARLETIDVKFGEIGEPDTRTDRRAELDAHRAKVSDALEAARAEIAQQREVAAAARSRGQEAARRLARLDEVGASCDACGQSVGDEHREQHAAELDATIAQARSEAAEAQQAADQAEQQASTLADDLRRSDQALQELGYNDLAYDQLIEEQEQLQRRAATYRASLDRLPDEHPDVDALYARRAELRLELDQARAAAARQGEIAAASRRLVELQEALAEVESRLTDATAAVEHAQPSADLTERMLDRGKLTETRRTEAEMVAHLDRQVAVNSERLSGAEKAFEQGERRVAAKRDHARRARVAEQASVLLTDVAETLATQIRPALEGVIANLLAQMSDGRFTDVSIDDEYNVMVSDDGKQVSLSSLSGGEQDLVSLAVRLALAEVVTERHGAGGAGFLILDEVFGFQDSSRQQTILSALRTLRASYGQILLISHVGGLDELADMVITVSASEDRQFTEVAIS